jgi:hypothetical protein
VVASAKALGVSIDAIRVATNGNGLPFVGRPGATFDVKSRLLK